MRPIKFRGKRIDTDGWVFGNLVNVRDGNMSRYYPCIVISYNHDSFDWIEVKPETVGQFTGLYDCEKKEIYEDDILSIAGMYYQIIFQDGCFGFKNDWSLFFPFSMSSLTKSKVKGSVHDNPELLEGGKK